MVLGWYAESYANAKDRDPAGPDSGTLRVLRGGGWFDDPDFCRAAIRYRGSPDSRLYYFGFRVGVFAAP